MISRQPNLRTRTYPRMVKASYSNVQYISQAIEYNKTYVDNELDGRQQRGQMLEWVKTKARVAERQVEGRK